MVFPFSSRKGCATTCRARDQNPSAFIIKMMWQLTISNRGVFLVAFLNRAAFQHLFFKYGFDQFAYCVEYVSLSFAQRTALVLLYPLIYTSNTKDLVTIFAFLRIIDKSKTDIAFEIFWRLSGWIHCWLNQVTIVIFSLYIFEKFFFSLRITVLFLFFLLHFINIIINYIISYI